jgi:hypothetical protein
VVDLAGSERNRDLTEHSAESFAETKDINWSLGCLKECIRNLYVKETANPDEHIKYRNCKLTLLLKEIFTSRSSIVGEGVGSGGDSSSVGTQRTVIIGCVGPMRKHHLVHCCYTVVAMLLYCCYTVVTLLLYSKYTLVILLSTC